MVFVGCPKPCAYEEQAIHGGYSNWRTSRVKRANASVVMAAIAQKGGEELQYASRAIKADKFIVMAAIVRSPHALAMYPLQYASKDIKADKDFVLKLIARWPRVAATIMQHAASALQADKEVVVLAVNGNPHALQFASAKLRGDREVVDLAVKADPSAIRHASFELREERRRQVQRDKKREKRGGVKGRQVGRRAMLPACNGDFPCALCWANAQVGLGNLPKRYNTKSPNLREQWRSHVKGSHDPSERVRAQFIGSMTDATGRKQYGLCVCGSTPCVYTGTPGPGDVWVRDPSAPAWQSELLASVRCNSK
eukprot:SAG25_NODE_865_length_5016_cov_52.478137_1_plen_310_part_00